MIRARGYAGSAVQVRRWVRTVRSGARQSGNLVGGGVAAPLAHVAEAITRLDAILVDEGIVSSRPCRAPMATVSGHVGGTLRLPHIGMPPLGGTDASVSTPSALM